MPYLLEVAINAEGSTLAYLGKGTKDGYTDDCCYRIAGPKAWGGSRPIARLEISDDDLVEFIKGYAPEIVEQLTAPNGEVRGASRRDGEASSAKGATSTVVLERGGRKP